MESLNSNDSATSKSVFDNHRFDKVAPQTGDIIIPQDKKPQRQLDPNALRRYAIFAGIGLAIVAFIAIIVVAIINLNKKDDNTNTSSKDPVAAQEAFDSMVQMIIYGGTPDDEEDSTSAREDAATIDDFEQLAMASSHGISMPVLFLDILIQIPNSDYRTAFYDVINEYYKTFAENYDGLYVDQVEHIGGYIRELPDVGYLTETSVFDYLASNTKNSTQDYINANVNADNTSSGQSIYYEYQDYLRGYLLSYLNILEESKTYGCTIDDNFTLCDITVLSTYPAYHEAKNAYYGNGRQILQNIRKNALQTIMEIYTEYYDDSSDNKAMSTGSSSL